MLTCAYAVAARGCGIVVRDELVPVAHRLAERGWLRRSVETEDVAWFWTEGAEQTLLTSECVVGRTGDVN